MTATADDDSGGQQRRWMMTACKIKQRTTRGKKESGRQTTTALGQPGREHETKTKKLSLCKKTFCSNMVGWLEFLLPPKTDYPPIRYISLNCDVHPYSKKSHFVKYTGLLFSARESGTKNVKRSNGTYIKSDMRESINK